MTVARYTFAVALAKNMSIKILNGNNINQNIANLVVD